MPLIENPIKFQLNMKEFKGYPNDNARLQILMQKMEKDTESYQRQAVYEQIEQKDEILEVKDTIWEECIINNDTGNFAVGPKKDLKEFTMIKALEEIMERTNDQRVEKIRNLN